jgi:hypothetical protein
LSRIHVAGKFTGINTITKIRPINAISLSSTSKPEERASAQVYIDIQATIFTIRATQYRIN